MKRLRLWREVTLGINTLWRHKLRSLLTMLGVVFGVGSVIAMLAVGEGASAEALEQIRKLGSQNIIIETVRPVEERDSRNVRIRMGIYGLLYEDEQRIAESLPSVRRTVPVKAIRHEGRLGARAMELRLVGTTPLWFDLVRRPLVAGRPLLAHDDAGRRNVVVLTETGARKLLATESVLGNTVRIGHTAFVVVGIVQSADGGGAAMPMPDQQVDAYIPLSVARERFGDVVSQQTSGTRIQELVELHQLLVEVDRIDQVEATAEAIESLLRRFHKKEDYRLHVPLALLRQAEATKRTFNIVLGSIAGISLLVGGIGIMNIMLASVTERTREIGIRRAIGAKRRQIVSQFLVETVALSTIGGVLGVGMGVTIPWIISRAAGMPTVVTMTSLVLALGISMAVGIVFGLYPAVRAARLDPIVALRHE